MIQKSTRGDRRRAKALKTKSMESQVTFVAWQFAKWAELKELKEIEDGLDGFAETLSGEANQEIIEEGIKRIKVEIEKRKEKEEKQQPKKIGKDES